MGVWLRETLNFFTSPRNDTFATEKKENLEKTSSVILSKPQVLVRGSALGWGVECAIVLSGKQSSRLQKLQLLSPRSFFFFFSLTGFNPGPCGQISGRDLTPEAWRNKVISSLSATPKEPHL